MMSFLITPPDQKTSGAYTLRCLPWMVVPAGFGGLTILEMVGKGFGLDEVNKCLSESFLNNPELPGGLLLVAPLTFFVILSFELPLGGREGGPRI